MTQIPAARRNVITVSTTSRPKRIAFLVDLENPSAGSWVDDIIEGSVQRWGGGHYPIVATDGRHLGADGWRVLKALDADVICAVTPIDEGLCQTIAESLAPAHIERLEERQREHVRGWILGHRLSGLDISDLPRHVAGLQPWGIPYRFLYLHETVDQDSGVRSFALRNFGTLRETISTKQTFEGLAIQKIGLGQIDARGLLESFTEFHGRTITLRDLSTAAAHRPYSLEYNGFAQGFHLVVGDSTRDIVFAWNRRLMSEEWTGHDLLWLPTSLAADEQFIDLVGKWIAHEYWNNQDRHGFVVSYSAEGALLQRVATAVSKSSWMPFAVRSLQAAELPFPETRPPAYGLLQEPPPRRTEQIALSGEIGLLSIPLPLFLTSRKGLEDGWMVDLDVEYHLDPPRFANKYDSWRVPKRVALGRKFVQSSGLARVVNGGLPSVEVKRSDQFIRLTIPSKTAILHGLFEPTRWGDADRKPRFSYFETSEQGRRLSGIIGLFGSLQNAGHTFDDRYWRDLFLHLSGIAESQSAPQVARATEMLEQSAIAGELTSPEQRTLLARRMVARLAYSAPSIPCVSWSELRRRFSDLKKTNPSDAHIAPGESFREFKELQAEDFLEGGILVQGVTIECQHCGKKDWWRTGELASELRCDGCLLSFPIPHDPAWLFRLNSLIRNGITKVGVLAVLHTLFTIQEWAHDFFWFLPCQALYEDYDGDPFTDLDLVAVRDGKVIIGEVKSSVEGFRDTDFAKLTSVAEEIRPDIVVVAATGSEWPPEVTREAERLKSRLETLGGTLEQLLLSW